MENNQEKSLINYSEDFFKRLETIYYLLLAIPLVFIALGFLSTESGAEPHFTFSANTLFWLNGLLTLFLVVDLLFIHFYYKKRIKAIDASADIRSKLHFFKNLSLLVYSAGFFYLLLLSLLYYLAHYEWSLPLYMGLLLYITFRRPSVAKAANDLKLSKEEFQSLDYRKA